MSATTYVYAPEDIVWHRTELGPDFYLSDNLVGTDYTTGFLSGTGSVTIGEQTWPTTSSS